MQEPTAPPMDPSAAQQQAPLPDFNDYRMQKLRALAQTYEIRLDWVSRLRQLESFNIVLLCDDSGSMGQVCAPGAGGSAPHDPFGRQPTRWTELQSTVSMLVQMATALDAQGSVDIYFLNRPPLLGVTDAAQIGVAFAHPPQGFTPLTRLLWHIVQAKQAVLAERRVLLLIATDGQPTDDSGNVRIPEFLQALQRKPANMHVQIMACTDDDSAMAYLNAADDSIPQLDVTDDYASERAEVIRAQGPSFHFSYGDYVVKALLGPVDSYFDHLDGSGARGGGGGGGGACCAIA